MEWNKFQSSYFTTFTEYNKEVFVKHEQAPTEMVKRHIYGPRPFIWAYNQVSMTFRSKVLADTSSSLEKPLFWDILANLTTSGRVFLTEMVKGTFLNFSFETI